MAASFQLPVYTAVQKMSDGNSYYWAQYGMVVDEDMIYPAQHAQITTLTNKIDHFEICLVNGNHYVVVLTTDNLLPESPP